MQKFMEHPCGFLHEDGKSAAIIYPIVTRGKNISGQVLVMQHLYFFQPASQWLTGISQLVWKLQ